MSGRQIWYKDKVAEWALGRNISTPEILDQNKVHVIKADGRFVIIIASHFVTPSMFERTAIYLDRA